MLPCPFGRRPAARCPRPQHYTPLAILPHCRTASPNNTVLLDPGLVAELEAEFAALDANGDGVLSFAEFKAILGITSTPEGLHLAQ